MRVSLGTFEFRDLEKPDVIPRGGKQNLAIREFPGGNVSIQDMGASYRPISWSGTFVGADAYDRMMSVGLMRTAGKSVDFSTDKYTFPVMIEEFLPDHKHDRRIPFTITLRHVVDSRASNKQLVDSIDKAASPFAGTENQPQEKTYVVKDGDTLYQIAATETVSKNPNDWETIYQDNVAVLPDGPQLIAPGTELKINV